jgi:hypothetical protein
VTGPDRRVVDDGSPSAYPRHRDGRCEPLGQRHLLGLIDDAHAAALHLAHDAEVTQTHRLRRVGVLDPLNEVEGGEARVQ